MAVLNYHDGLQDPQQVRRSTVCDTVEGVPSGECIILRNGGYFHVYEEVGRIDVVNAVIDMTVSYSVNPKYRLSITTIYKKEVEKLAAMLKEASK